METALSLRADGNPSSRTFPTCPSLPTCPSTDASRHLLDYGKRSSHYTLNRRPMSLVEESLSVTSLLVMDMGWSRSLEPMARREWARPSGMCRLRAQLDTLALSPVSKLRMTLIDSLLSTRTLHPPRTPLLLPPSPSPRELVPPRRTLRSRLATPCREPLTRPSATVFTTTRSAVSFVLLLLLTPPS